MNVTAAKRIIRYLKGTVSIVIRFARGDNFTLTGYADADFASNYKMDERSTTGYIFMVNVPILPATAINDAVNN